MLVVESSGHDRTCEAHTPVAHDRRAGDRTIGNNYRDRYLDCSLTAPANQQQPVNDSARLSMRFDGSPLPTLADRQTPLSYSPEPAERLTVCELRHTAAGANHVE